MAVSSWGAFNRLMGQAAGAGYGVGGLNSPFPGIYDPGAFQSMNRNPIAWTMTGSPELGMLQQEQARQAAMTKKPLEARQVSPFIQGQSAYGAVPFGGPGMDLNALRQLTFPFLGRGLFG